MHVLHERAPSPFTFRGVQSQVEWAAPKKKGGIVTKGGYDNEN